MWDFDVLVWGSGQGGQKAVIAAAKLERRNLIDGVRVNTGTIPSKTLREPVTDLTGFDQRSTHGQSYRMKDESTAADLVNGFVDRKACADVRL
jgi:pyruvate/2-oxoglutarate dehydrogenase complex dihydrolipoamide dehydrogenase (E3) component